MSHRPARGPRDPDATAARPAPTRGIEPPGAGLQRGPHEARIAALLDGDPARAWTPEELAAALPDADLEALKIDLHRLKARGDAALAGGRWRSRT